MTRIAIDEVALKRRAHWLDRIATLSGSFGSNTQRIEKELSTEMTRDGVKSLLDHLRMCGNIPESYAHDSTEEKLYSKYTDIVLAQFLRKIGLKASVLTERGDAADVEAVHEDWALVADAKAFRLSRTAKNQKDFKVDAMFGWKRGRKHALLVCPSYQLPMRSSQIYQTAIARDVTILSYAHIAALSSLAEERGGEAAILCLEAAMNSAEDQLPTKEALFYWTLINRSMLGASKNITEHWIIEKQATTEVLFAAKEEAILSLAREREQIQRMSHEEAISALINYKNIEGKIRTIERVSNNQMLRLE